MSPLPKMIASVFLLISMTFLQVDLTKADASTNITIHNSTTSNIVGGTIAGYGMYPFFAISGGLPLCGASLIHPDILLTTAHCADAFQDTFVSIGGNSADSSDA